MFRLMVMNLSGKSKTFEMVIVICGIKIYPLHCTKVICFVAFRVTSEVLGIGAAEISWGDIKN